MKNKGIKRTNTPLLYEVNYPEHGQVGFLVRMNRRGRTVYKIFNFSIQGSRDKPRKAAEQYAKQFNRQYPVLRRGAKTATKKRRGR